MEEFKPVVALDIDGVLADFEKQFNRKYREYFGFENQDNLILSSVALEDYLCLDKEELQSFITYLLDDMDCPVIPGAVEGCASLREMGCHLIIITNRLCDEATRNWLEVNGFWNIKPYFLKLGDDIPSFDYILDDSPHKIAALLWKTNHKSYLMKSVQNLGCSNILNRYECVENWADFLNKINLDLRFAN